MDHFDLDGAVRAGIIRSDQADALRRFDETRRHAPAATEEHFRLVSGFADIMSAIGILMVTVTVIAMVGSALPPACLLLPIPCWAAARYFTVKRRLMLSSAVLFGAFALTSAMTALALAAMVAGFDPRTAGPDDLPGLAFLVTAAVATVASYGWWRRFQLPIAFASFAVALVNVGINSFRALFPHMPGIGVELLSAATGPILFAWAMWWDVSDVRRETVRSDVAFWLHIAAGFVIVKSTMVALLGRQTGAEGWGRIFARVADPSAGQAGVVLLLFLAFAAVAIVIDRRSLLTSGMMYAVPAVGTLIGSTGVGAINPAFFFCGVILIVLAVRWTSIRELLLRRLPDTISAQLPRPQTKAVGPRPVY